jgi:MFS transporter, DHA2 family, multidrug resistance protein
LGILSVKTGAANEMSANGIIYQQLLRQSSLFSFVDAFHAAGIIMLCVLPLVFLLKRISKEEAPAVVH